MAGSTFTPSYSGLGNEVLRAGFMVEEMVSRAERVMAEAVATAPVYAGPGHDPHRGRYKASFSVHGTAAGGVKGDRAAGIVSNDAPEAFYVEFGTRNNRAHATLRNALNAAG